MTKGQREVILSVRSHVSAGCNVVGLLSNHFACLAAPQKKYLEIFFLDFQTLKRINSTRNITGGLICRWDNSQYKSAATFEDVAQSGLLRLRLHPPERIVGDANLPT